MNTSNYLGRPLSPIADQYMDPKYYCGYTSDDARLPQGTTPASSSPSSSSTSSSTQHRNANQDLHFTCNDTREGFVLEVKCTDPTLNTRLGPYLSMEDIRDVKKMISNNYNNFVALNEDIPKNSYSLARHRQNQG